MAPRRFRLQAAQRRLSKFATTTDRRFVSQVRGLLKDLADEVESIIKHMGDEGPEILLEALQPTFAKSQTYVPVAKGDLKRSGFLEIVQGRGQEVVEMGYGKGGQPPYTVFVHERLDLAHQSPTRAKFLQSAVEEDMNSIKQRVTSISKRTLGVS